ncbi:hypothetical protein BO70DRAFT_398255 [Aspergillus heteromorphus CBS 117.55]|uniref:Uncharacterized protein n=1 Tax=Aspergillus heteromorphus CBS 117.55 TaxID=1448321 RepID=A0A317VR71_9EURO|nr:uncharacterized protein BO70DRAFT_398255 [Aspergillus heteromorphus CBS 117.55]PWY75398.1 hypothetical protein BO70DRAFT_398255 [Aspergillus heteromorphus CBS 117.55]
MLCLPRPVVLASVLDFGLILRTRSKTSSGLDEIRVQLRSGQASLIAPVSSIPSDTFTSRNYESTGLNYAIRFSRVGSRSRSEDHGLSSRLSQILQGIRYAGQL